MQIFCGEGGERTYRLSYFIFNALGSADSAGAPNFPPHDLVTVDIKSKTFLNTYVTTS
jgi:hypothetical protein